MESKPAVADDRRALLPLRDHAVADERRALFPKMSLAPSSVVDYYLGSEDSFLPPRSAQGLLEISHFHLFAMGMLLLVLTHLVLFVPLAARTKAWLIVLPFVSALADEAAGWLVRFVSPHFAWLKVGGFLALQTSLALLVGLSLWAVCGGSQRDYEGSRPDAAPRPDAPA